MLDVVIGGAQVMNGTGSPWFEADVAVKAGRIESIGDLAGEDTREYVDAGGLVLAPGFIDIHSHSDFNFLVDPGAPSKLLQGVTSEVIGQCGISAAPRDVRGMAHIREHWPEVFGPEISLSSLSQYLDLLRRRSLSVNAIPVVGHGNIRTLAMGEEDRPPSVEEMDKMRQILRDALRDGAFGMSTGLIYPPGVYCAKEELVCLGEVLGEFDAVYFTHLRNERENLIEAVQEAIDIGQRGGCRVQISHLKAFERANWGLVGEALRVMELARKEGLDVTGDAYPYTASSTSLKTTLPDWMHDGGKEVMLRRLDDAAARDRIIDKWGDSIKWEDIMIATVRRERNRSLEGHTVAELATRRGMDPREFVLDLLSDDDAETTMIYRGMCEEDVRQVLSNPLIMVGSDGSSISPEGPLGGGNPHPRNYGTFPRVLGKYARDEGIMSVETAVAKMTSWPAAKLGLFDRGLIAPGFVADLVLFDPDRIGDAATYEDPHRFPMGVDMVLVNGCVAVRGGRPIGESAGEVLIRS
ncbi:MAG: N-acyl-D-amino-acid deacylase family protein [Bacillota bacterium]